MTVIGAGSYSIKSVNYNNDITVIKIIRIQTLMFRHSALIQSLIMQKLPVISL